MQKTSQVYKSNFSFNMKINIVPLFFSLCVVILNSCTIQRRNIVFPIPVSDEESGFAHIINIDNIIETKSGRGNSNLPDWLIAFDYGGIEEVERISLYYDRYCYIGRNQGTNFDALMKWADNYSVVQDFTRLAAARIEKKLISAATLYPDNEYGLFFERLVKKAYDSDYPDAVIEDTYWIRKTGENGLNDIYEFFIFISIDKITMQSVINRMIADVRTDVTPTRAQTNVINRLQQTFFEGF